MRYWVGVIDNRGFEFLAERKPEEINFWQPNGTRAFQAIEPGSPFLFKLHSPQNFIVGGGLFVKHSLLPLSIAWDTFGIKNGAPDLTSFASLIRKYREQRGNPEADPTIGCIILASPFFLSRNDWIPAPGDWSPNLVQGKSYNTDEASGAELWSQVQERLGREPAPADPPRQLPLLFQELTQYGSVYLNAARPGPGAFRVLVTEAYDRSCAVTGVRTLPVLQATHIKPPSRSGANQVSNGILLRSDLRLLFEAGYMTITTDCRIEISRRLHEFEDAGNYKALHGNELKVLPVRTIEQPSTELLSWHNANVFLP